MNQPGRENMENKRFSDESWAGNRRNARYILLQLTVDDDQQYRFNYQYGVDKHGDISIRDQLLNATDDALQQD